jgi:hypothetical protein
LISYSTPWTDLAPRKDPRQAEVSEPLLVYKLFNRQRAYSWQNNVFHPF